MGWKRIYTCRPTYLPTHSPHSSTYLNELLLYTIHLWICTILTRITYWALIVYVCICIFL